ncbi:MAG: endo alpha-1,4 polygalactosaminidase [Spirochaetales bacterium]|nr:endo alpha-1,4 polygalactosaminidase [Spirochaetales bacterium]
MRNVDYVLIAVIFIFSGCTQEPDTENSEYRDYMRSFVQDIGSWVRQQSPGFIVIPQNGQELLAADSEPDGMPAAEYISAIDGVGREDLFYGYDDDNTPTSEADRQYMTAFMDLAEANGIEVLVTDYCWTHGYMDSSYSLADDAGYISFAADSRELDLIPDYPVHPYNVNNADITDLSDAANFLYLLNPSDNASVFPSASSFLSALQSTDYDLFIIDLFFDGTEATAFTTSQVSALKQKAGGGSRLVIAYMSIGEAEDYRYYWQSEWDSNPPDWLSGENPEWEGNYKVRYWMQEWQDIIFGNNDSYLQKIIDAGFDGVYLDIIDAFEYFEDQ